VRDELREGLVGVKRISVADTLGEDPGRCRAALAVNDGVWREHRGALSEHLPSDEHSLMESAQRHRRQFIDRLAAKRDTDEADLSEYERRLPEDFIVESSRAALVLATAPGVPWRTRRRMKREFIKCEKDHGPQLRAQGRLAAGEAGGQLAPTAASASQAGVCRSVPRRLRVALPHDTRPVQAAVTS
jgi:hypothetical protein